jgi:hypothetical protein
MNTLVTQERSSVTIPNFPLYGKDKDGNQKLRGTSFRFGSGDSAQSASDLKKMLKEQGLKPSLIKKQVNEVLTGKVDLAYLQMQAFMAGMRAEGYIPDKASKTARTGEAKWIKIGPVAPVRTEKAIREAALADIKTKLIALGLSEEDIAAL